MFYDPDYYSYWAMYNKTKPDNIGTMFSVLMCLFYILYPTSPKQTNSVIYIYKQCTLDLHRLKIWKT